MRLRTRIKVCEGEGETLRAKYLFFALQNWGWMKNVMV